jgi:hypothetical protein
MGVHSTVRPTAQEPLDEGLVSLEKVGVGSLLGNCRVILDYAILVGSVRGINLFQSNNQAPEPLVPFHTMCIADSSTKTHIKFYFYCLHSVA